MNKILIVEDNEMNRDMLSRRLLRKGFEVQLAVDGLQGLEAATQQKPDLILMDLSLPVIDGWEATRRIKANPTTRAIPVIALTAHAMAEDRQKALEAGCDDFDTKPVDLDRLLTKITALLNREQVQSETKPISATQLLLSAELGSLEVLKKELASFLQQGQASDGLRADWFVVLDEVVANICMHAYAGQAQGLMKVAFKLEPSDAELRAALSMSFTDWGQPFNPLDQTTPQLVQSIEDRRLGGMGIQLIRQLTDSQIYQRLADGGNQLTVRKFFE